MGVSVTEVVGSFVGGKCMVAAGAGGGGII